MSEPKLPADAQYFLDGLRALLPGLTDEERERIFYEVRSGYCPHCGAEEPPDTYCTCLKDE